MDNLFENIRSLKDRVDYILRKYPECRNSDAELIIRVASTFAVDPVKNASSIERVRRQFNQKRMHLPTVWAVAKQRKINIEIWKEALGYKPNLFNRV